MMAASTVRSARARDEPSKPYLRPAKNQTSMGPSASRRGKSPASGASCADRRRTAALLANVRFGSKADIGSQFPHVTNPTALICATLHDPNIASAPGDLESDANRR